MPLLPYQPTIAWQPTDGPFYIWDSFSQALQELKYEPQRVVVMYQLPRLHQPANILHTNAIQSQPDSSLFTAVGIATANPALKVVVCLDSLQLYQTNLDQLLAVSRQHHNLTIVSFNTEADISASQTGLIAAISADCSFVARAFAGDPGQTKELFKSALRHDGTALLDILIPSNSSPSSSYALYRRRLFALQDPGDAQAADWPANNATAAIQMLSHHSDRLDTGLLYRHAAPSYQTQLHKRLGSALVDQPLKNISVRSLLPAYK